MQQNLHSLCNNLRQQFSSGYLFWYTNPPRNYSTGLLLSGSNFMLCGANPLNELDNRWLTQNEIKLNDFTVHAEAKAQPLIIWSDMCIKQGRILPCDFCSILSIDAYNAWQLTPPPELLKHTNFVDLNAISKLSPYPYKTLKGLAAFEVPKDKNLCDYIYSNILNLLRKQSKTHLIFGSKEDAWNRITANISLCKILFTLGYKPQVDCFYDITLSILNRLTFDNPEDRLALFKCFSAADSCIAQLLTASNANNSIPDHLKYFINGSTWEKIKTLGSEEQIMKLKINTKSCKENSEINFFTLRFITNTDNETLEFYCSTLEKDKVQGLLKSGNLILPVSLSLTTLKNMFTPDLSFSPCSKSSLNDL